MSFRRSRALPAIVIAATLAGPAQAASLEFQLFLHQGYRSFKVGDYFKARDYFTRAVDLSLRSAEARIALGESLAALGQYQEAVIQLRHGVRIDSRWPEKDYPRYGLWPDQKTLDAHLQKLRLDVANFSKDANARLLLAYNLFHLGLLPDAAELFIEAENILGKKDSIARAYLSEIKSRNKSIATEPPPPVPPVSSSSSSVPAAPAATPELPKVDGAAPADPNAPPPPPPDSTGAPPPPPPDAGGNGAPPPPPPDVPPAAPPAGK